MDKNTDDINNQKSKSIDTLYDKWQFSWDEEKSGKKHFRNSALIN